MHFTYVLKQKDKSHFYIGYTTDLKRRLQEHNVGLTRSTKGRKWILYCYFVFGSELVAKSFEHYLKTGSGRAFSKKHFQFKSMDNNQIDEA